MMSLLWHSAGVTWLDIANFLWHFVLHLTTLIKLAFACRLLLQILLLLPLLNSNMVGSTGCRQIEPRDDGVPKLTSMYLCI